jgi:hypothetical protein
VLLLAVAYTLNIGHRRFPRDATEDLPSRRTPLPVSTRRHTAPVVSSPGLSPGWSGVRLRQLVCRKLSQPCPSRFFASPVRRAVCSTPPDIPLTQHASTHAPHAAQSCPANPFLESPADSGTQAPNLQKLRQAGDARQDLVRISESTTKCGDCGEESGGDAEVSKIRGESESALRARPCFHSPGPSNLTARAGLWDLAWACGSWVGLDRIRQAVTHSSRADGDFPAILSEITRNS